VQKTSNLRGQPIGGGRALSTRGLREAEAAINELDSEQSDRTENRGGI
jgi:hypothetical protein